MSADRQRLVSSIRRIANTDPDKLDSLADGNNKGGKPGAAGVGGGQGEGKEGQICCDGSTGDPNPGADERDPGDGGQDGLNPDDPADIDQGGGTLDGVTDCATGEPICFDGAGFIAPDGWDEPNEPPIDSTYEEGIYYRAYYAGTVEYVQTKAEAQSLVCDALQACRIASGSGLGVGACRDDILGFNSSCSGDGYSWSTVDCSTDYHPICDEPPPLAESWPSDGCVNLVIKGGKIVGSKFDPENDGSYSAPRDSIDLCSNGDQISLAPAANGGWKTINSTTDNGYLYNSKNERIAHIDGNEYSDPSV